MAKRAKKLIDTTPLTARTELDSTAYNEAVRLQCAIRDKIGFPISLLQALTFARRFVANEISPTLAESIRADYENEARDREKQRLEEQARIAAEAGKR